MANTKKTASSKSSSKKYPSSKFNNKAIENTEKNSVNVNVAVGKKDSDVNVAQDALDEMRRKSEITDDIVIICSILVAILLLLSLFDLCGIIGHFFKNLMMGLLGRVIAFIFPFAFVFFVFFTRSNKGNPIATRKTIYFWIMVILCCGVLNLAVHNSDVFDLGAAYKSHTGGGMIGELISYPLFACFGNIAAILILITLMFICLMLITGKAIIHLIRSRQREKKEMMRQIREEEREEEERRKAAAAQQRPAATYNDFKQMSLEDIQEENRRKKLMLVNLEAPQNQPPVAPSAYELPKAKKKLSIIDRLKGYGKEKTSGNNAANTGDITAYQPIVNATSTTPATPEQTAVAHPASYQAQLDNKFKNEPSGKKENDIFNSASYEENVNGIPEITGGYSETVYNESEPLPGPYIPPEEAEPLTGNAFEEAAFHGNPFESGYEDNADYSDKFDGKEIAFSAKSNQSANAHTSSAAGAVNSTGSGKKVSEAPEEINIDESNQVSEKPYIFPSIELLRKPDKNQRTMSVEELKETAAKLKNTLHSFGVNVTVTNFTSGPNVTRYELQPEVGTKVSRITALADDIKLNLAAEDIRIEAPIPGKSAVGIEVPNTKGSTVFLRSLFESDKFRNGREKIAFAVGKDIAGDTVVTDIAKMPHVLIAGATGSGKSVCINTIIMSILYRYTPKEVKMIMVDPKVVELSVYNGIPHLLIPVVTDPKKAYGALNWAVQEMMNRYKWFSELEVRDIEGYNEKLKASSVPIPDNEGNERAVLPQIVIIVDEMADLMMVSPGEVEEAICRLAQLARAAGIHLVLATQRPTVNVITGLIKANVPSRVAFAVASATDSRTILDQTGAEKLLGKGDMLFFPTGIPKPIRVQGAFVSDEEVKAVVSSIKDKNSSEGNYSANISEQIDLAASDSGKKNGGSSDSSANDSDHDELFAQAGKFIIEKDKASIGLLQRMYKIGFNRAARIMDQLAEAGVVGPEEGTKPRTILMSQEQFENYLEQNGG